MICSSKGFVNRSVPILRRRVGGRAIVDWGDVPSRSSRGEFLNVTAREQGLLSIDLPHPPVFVGLFYNFNDITS